MRLIFFPETGKSIQSCMIFRSGSTGMQYLTLRLMSVASLSIYQPCKIVGCMCSWKCLWPDCHNCCERQGRLPLTKDDISRIAQKVGYTSKAEFVRDETTISSWQEEEPFGNVITTLTMLSLKKKKGREARGGWDATRCRFLDTGGKQHPPRQARSLLALSICIWVEVDEEGSLHACHLSIYRRLSRFLS